MVVANQPKTHQPQLKQTINRKKVIMLSKYLLQGINKNSLMFDNGHENTRF